jgi:hypothetical protein
VKQRRLLEKVSRGWPAKDEAIPKIQIGQRQVSEYQEGGMSFGLGYGASSNRNFTRNYTVLYFTWRYHIFLYVFFYNLILA